MKTNEILQGNRILAEFITGRPKDSKVFFDLNCVASDLKYYTSWDWLMPVVEKIESLNYSTVIYSMGSGNHRMVVYSGGAIVTQSKLMESKIKSVFAACVKFAEWYKKQ